MAGWATPGKVGSQVVAPSVLHGENGVGNSKILPSGGHLLIKSKCPVRTGCNHRDQQVQQRTGFSRQKLGAKNSTRGKTQSRGEIASSPSIRASQQRDTHRRKGRKETHPTNPCAPRSAKKRSRSKGECTHQLLGKTGLCIHDAGSTQKLAAAARCMPP